MYRLFGLLGVESIYNVSLRLGPDMLTMSAIQFRDLRHASIHPTIKPAPRMGKPYATSPPRKGHHGPSATPRPFPGAAVRAPTLHGPQSLVVAWLQTHHDVSLARAEGQDVDPRPRPQRADGLCEWRRGVPSSLNRVSILFWVSHVHPIRGDIKREKRGEGEGEGATYIVGQLTVVQVALEHDELARLEVIQQLPCLGRQAPEAARVCPEAVWSEDELSLGVEASPFLEEEAQLRRLLVGERCRRLLLVLLVVRGRLVEGPRIREGAEQGGEVPRQDVRHEPGDRLGMQHDERREPGREQVPGEDEVDVELEARIVEDDVHPPLRLALALRLVEKGVGGAEVVDQDVLLGRLPRLGPLQLLDVFVRQARKQREVGGVAPETDLAHLGEQQPPRLLVVVVARPALVGLHLHDEILVARRELEDGGARGAERVYLLPGEDVVALPVRREAEGRAQAPVEVAFAE